MDSVDLVLADNQTSTCATEGKLRTKLTLTRLIFRLMARLICSMDLVLQAVLPLAAKIRYQAFKKDVKASAAMVAMVWMRMVSPYGKSLARSVIALTFTTSVLGVLTPVIWSVVFDSGLSAQALRASHSYLFGFFHMVGIDFETGYVGLYFLIFGIISYCLSFVSSALLDFFRGNRSELMVADNALHVDMEVMRSLFSKAVITHIVYEKLIGFSTVNKGRDKVRNIQDVILWMATTVIIGLTIYLVADFLSLSQPIDRLVLVSVLVFSILDIIYLGQQVIFTCRPIEELWIAYNHYRDERYREYKTVIYNNKQEYELRKTQEKFEVALEKDAPFWAWVYPIHYMWRKIILQTLLAAIVAHSAYRMIMGEISVGTLSSLVVWNSQIMAYLIQLSDLEHQFNHVTPSILKLKKALDLPVGIEQSETGLESLPQDKPFNIKFDHVDFRYPVVGEAEGYSEKSGQMAVENLSFEVPAGKRVALIGPSGAGKSTTITMVMGGQAPTSGKIFFGGIDSCRLDWKSLRRVTSFIPQEADVLDGTARYNVGYGRPDPESVTDEEFARVSKLVKLDFLINGPDTLLGTRGIKLSGGQKQRIVIARALLKDPRLVVLDEGTNSLDPSSKKEVQENLDLLVRKDGITVITITHDLNAVRDYDFFCVLDKPENGKGSQIVASGTSLKELARKCKTLDKLASDGGIVL